MGKKLKLNEYATVMKPISRIMTRVGLRSQHILHKSSLTAMWNIYAIISCKCNFTTLCLHKEQVE